MRDFPLLFRAADQVSVISKLQISNAMLGGDKLSIVLGFCEGKRTGFSNPVNFDRF
jgi:hypothetical protein